MELSKTYDGVELADISSKTKHMEYIQESNQSNIGSSMEDNPVYGEVGNRPGIDRSFEENLSYWEIRRSNEPDQTVMKRNPAYGKMFIRTERENVCPSTKLDRTNTRIGRTSKTLRTTVFLALLASCLALAAGIASISLLKRSTIASKNEIDLLKGEIQELREKLNQSRLEMNSLKQNIDFTDTVEISTELNIIRSSVNTLNAVQQSMATQLINQHTSIEALNTTSTQLDEQMSSLQSTADTLNTKINSPVNLYQNCYEETRVCRIDPTSGVFFTRECSTSALVSDIQVQIH